MHNKDLLSPYFITFSKNLIKLNIMSEYLDVSITYSQIFYMPFLITISHIFCYVENYFLLLKHYNCNFKKQFIENLKIHIKILILYCGLDFYIILLLHFHSRIFSVPCVSLHICTLSTDMDYYLTNRFLFEV